MVGLAAARRSRVRPVFLPNTEGPNMLMAKRRFGRLAVAVFSVALAGPARAADGSSGAPASGGAAFLSNGAPQVPKGMRQEAIHDPATNRDAYFVAIPADWRFQAAFIQGTGCSDAPFPVFRASSSDGLNQLERLPRFDWTFGTAPWLAKKTPPGCLPLREAMSGADFLKHLSAISEVEYLSEVPVAADKLAAQRKYIEQLNASSAQMAARFHNDPIVHQGDIAQAKVRYRNGDVSMEAFLFVNLACSHNPFRNFKKQTFSVDNCTATVRVVRAPQGKLDEVVKKLEPAGAFESQQWAQARMELDNRRAQAMAKQTQDNFNQQMQLQNQQFQQSEALKLQQHQQFQQSQAMQQQQHEQFLSTMQRGTDMSMQRAQQNAAASHTAASDTVDYALGQQTVRDPNTGQVSKVSAAYNNTWVNDTGTHAYQTNNPNGNPNGYVQGNWTRQEQVHGDGTSK